MSERRKPTKEKTKFWKELAEAKEKEALAFAAKIRAKEVK